MLNLRFAFRFLSLWAVQIHFLNSTLEIKNYLPLLTFEKIVVYIWPPGCTRCLATFIMGKCINFAELLSSTTLQSIHVLPRDLCGIYSVTGSHVCIKLYAPVKQNSILYIYYIVLCYFIVMAIRLLFSIMSSKVFKIQTKISIKYI